MFIKIEINTIYLYLTGLGECGNNMIYNNGISAEIAWCR